MRTRDLAGQLFLDGYDALRLQRRQADAQNEDGFWTKMLGRRTLVVRGPSASEFFYDQDNIKRTGAVPRLLADLLFGHEAVHGLDGSEHVDRKRVFVDLLTPDRIEELGRFVDHDLRGRAYAWTTSSKVSLFEELVDSYGSQVIRWAGIPVAGARESRMHARELADIVDGFGFAGLAYARAWRARTRCDRWARSLIAGAREGRISFESNSVLHALALGPGSQLSVDVAGVELLNILRPTVAVAWISCFAVHALIEHPQYGSVLTDPRAVVERQAFCNEVRRLALFVPGLTGIVRRDCAWDGHVLAPGDRVVLDVPGTNRHVGTWSAAADFRPERFASGDVPPFAFVPQGGGDVRAGHRCPGEGIAMTLMEQTVQLLAGLQFKAKGNLMDRGRIPTLPAGGIELSHVRYDGARTTPHL